MGNVVTKVVQVVLNPVEYVVHKVMDFLFPIKTQLKIYNETTTKLQEIRIESIGDTYFDTIILSSPNAQTTIAITIRRVDDDCRLKVQLSFANDLKDIFQFNQSYADNRAYGFEFKRTLCSHKISYKKEGDKTMKVVIAHTQEQLDNDLAEELIKDALSKSQQKRFKEALSKLEEAQKKASSSTIKDKICKGQAYVLNSQGLDEETQGFNLENEDMADDAASKFNNAKECFQRAQEYSANSEQSINLNRVSCKINGNKLINEGNDLLEEAQLLNQNAGRLKEQNCYELAVKDCDLALQKCKLAEDLYRQGSMDCNDNRFDESLKFVRETIEQTNKIKTDAHLNQCNARNAEQKDASRNMTRNIQCFRQI